MSLNKDYYLYFCSLSLSGEKRQHYNVFKLPLSSYLVMCQVQHEETVSRGNAM